MATYKATQGENRGKVGVVRERRELLPPLWEAILAWSLPFLLRRRVSILSLGLLAPLSLAVDRVTGDERCGKVGVRRERSRRRTVELREDRVGGRWWRPYPKRVEYPLLRESSRDGLEADLPRVESEGSDDGTVAVCGRVDGAGRAGKQGLDGRGEEESAVSYV